MRGLLEEGKKIVLKNKKKPIITIIIGILCLTAIIVGTQVYKNRGGVNVKCSKDYPVSEGLVSYRQDDAAWKDIHLGDSEYTMGSSGCITTCIATAISETEGAMDPGELAVYMSDENVFDDEGNMQWGELDDLAGFHADVYSFGNAEYIDECLSKGRYPIVKVHRNSLLSYHHFVLIVGSRDGEYICMDPLEDSLTKLSDYGNRIYSVRCVWYKNEMEDFNEHDLDMIKRLPKNKEDTDEFLKSMRLAVIEVDVDGDPCYTTTSVVDFSCDKLYFNCVSFLDYTETDECTPFLLARRIEYINDIKNAVEHIETLNNAETDPYENEYKDLTVKIIIANDDWTIQKFECSVPGSRKDDPGDMLSAFAYKFCDLERY